MNIYIDCEWNDYRGPLISMALVAADGREFYEVLECNNPSVWIAHNVMPILGKNAVSLGVFRANLRDFLNEFDSVHIVADWPEDIEHFSHQLIIGPGERIGPDRMTMEFVRLPPTVVSLMPHNALEDAKSIRRHLEA